MTTPKPDTACYYGQCKKLGRNYYSGRLPDGKVKHYFLCDDHLSKASLSMLIDCDATSLVRGLSIVQVRKMTDELREKNPSVVMESA